MATSKKATTKKPVTKLAGVHVSAKSKKSPVKKATVKKTAVKKTAASADMRSFRIAKEQGSFTTFRITRQTFYWVVLVSFIIFAQLWIISLQVEIASLLDAQQTQVINQQ